MIELGRVYKHKSGNLYYTLCFTHTKGEDREWYESISYCSMARKAKTSSTEVLYPQFNRSIESFLEDFTLLGEEDDLPNLQ